jgi:hypothetical protein
MSPHRVLLLDHARLGTPSWHPDRIEGCVEFTTEVAEIENIYHSHTGIAVKLCDDPWFHLTCDAVHEVIGVWLGIQHYDIEVEFYPTKGFIVLLPLAGAHDNVLVMANSITI